MRSYTVNFSQSIFYEEKSLENQVDGRDKANRCTESSHRKKSTEGAYAS